MSELFPEHESHGTAHPAGGKKGGLNAKVGGIPVWILGVAGGGVLLVIFLYLRNRSSAMAAAASTTPATAYAGENPNLAYDDPNQTDPNTGETYAEEGYTTQSAVDAYLAGDTSGASTPVGLSPQGLPAPQTNTQWASLAADYLIGQGDDPTTVSNALNAYTNGTALTAAEQAIVNLAIQQFGEPPQGILPISTAPAAPASTTPTTTTTTPSVPTPAPATALSSTVVVPNVVGQSYAHAQQTIEEAGLYSYPHNSVKDPSHISATNPPAGKSVPRDSGVDLVLAAGAGT